MCSVIRVPLYFFYKNNKVLSSSTDRAPEFVHENTELLAELRANTDEVELPGRGLGTLKQSLQQRVLRVLDEEL